MVTSRVVNIVAGSILIGCGVLGCFWPVLVADYYGLVIEQLDAKTMIRTLAGFCAGVGCLLVYFAMHLDNQRPILLVLIVVLLSFALPRTLGLLIDGFAQPLMWYELGFELLALIFVSIIYFGDKTRYKVRQDC